MKKLVAIALSILFCITLTCCGAEDALVGLPEIPRDERIYYNGTRVEKGEGLDEARPVTECPYDEEPTFEQAEKDGAFIIISDFRSEEKVVKNPSVLERFSSNVNRGIDDSLLVFNVRYEKNGKKREWAEYYYYVNDELRVVTYGSTGTSPEQKNEKVVADGEYINLALYQKNPLFVMPYDVRGVFLPYKYKDISSEYNFYIHNYTPYNFVELTEASTLYEDGITEKFVNVAGVHEGNGKETKLYKKYPFEESFPTAIEVFDLGGVIVLDNDFATKAYNIAVLEQFRQNLLDGIPDTLFVYTDDGTPALVMYSYTGDSLLITNDERGGDPRALLFTTELFGDEIKFGRYGGAESENFTTGSESKMYERKVFSVSYQATKANGETVNFRVDDSVEIPSVYYVTEHIVPESEAKNYK